MSCVIKPLFYNNINFSFMTLNNNDNLYYNNIAGEIDCFIKKTIILLL